MKNQLKRRLLFLGCLIFCASALGEVGSGSSPTNDPSKISIPIRLPSPIREQFIQLANFVMSGNTPGVLKFAHSSFLNKLKARKYENLNDFIENNSRTKSLVVNYCEFRKEEGHEYCIIYFDVISGGRDVPITKYSAHSLWLKTVDGWRYLNLPFKDYILAVSMSHLVGGPLEVTK